MVSGDTKSHLRINGIDSDLLEKGQEVWVGGGIHDDEAGVDLDRLVAISERLRVGMTTEIVGLFEQMNVVIGVF